MIGEKKAKNRIIRLRDKALSGKNCHNKHINKTEEKNVKIKICL